MSTVKPHDLVAKLESMLTALKERPQAQPKNSHGVFGRSVGGIDNDLDVWRDMRVRCDVEAVEGFNHVLISQSAIRGILPGAGQADDVVVLPK